MAATLKQIAAKTGLSIPTVHQILNGYSAPFADATRKKVMAAAEAMNYRPNMSARSLVTQRSFLIGILFYGPNYAIVTPFMSGVQSTVKAHGCSPIFFTHNSSVEELENLHSVLDRRVDGLIVNVAVDEDAPGNAERLSQLERKGTRIVEVFGRLVPGVPKVTLDYRAAARVMTAELIAQGHRRIALLIRENYHESNADLVGGRYWNATDFWLGYKSVMTAAALKLRVHKYPVDASSGEQNAHFVGASRVIDSLFRNPAEAPTAVVCYSDESAEALVLQYERLGAAAIAPLTISTLRGVRPSLSDRVRVLNHPFPLEQAGRAAAEAVFKRMAGEAVDDMPLGPIGSESLKSLPPAAKSGKHRRSMQK